jgi:hypothetical protein
VDVNNNGDPNDDVLTAFDPQVDGIVRLSPGQPYWKTLYDDYTLNFNNNPHISWTRANGVAAYDPVTDLGGVQNYGNHIALNEYGINIISAPNCVNNELCTGEFNPGVLSSVIYRSNAAGTVWDRFENHIINDEGKLATVDDFSANTRSTGNEARSTLKDQLLGWNFQQIITASEFNGRKIDLVFTPRVLIQSGLIP